MYSAVQLAFKYFKYYFNALSANGHGVHSPFVFQFIKFVKNDKTKYECYENIEAIRKQLLQNNTTIEVQDFGAGSTVLKYNKRVVSKMAASSLKPKRFAQLLYRMVNFYKPKTIVELGTSFGVTTSYLASGNAEAQVYTFEGAASIAAIAKNNFDKLSIKNIELSEGSFDKTLQPFLQNISTIDFAFIDGNHAKKPTLEYFHQLLEKSHENSIFIFDDIHWSKGMEVAWEEIKQHSSVTLSIDLFFIGIVFFKKDFKIKQDFSLRF